MCDEHALYNKSNILLILYIVRCTNTQHRQFYLTALKLILPPHAKVSWPKTGD